MFAYLIYFELKGIQQSIWNELHKQVCDVFMKCNTRSNNSKITEIFNTLTYNSLLCSVLLFSENEQSRDWPNMLFLLNIKLGKLIILYIIHNVIEAIAYYTCS